MTVSLSENIQIYNPWSVLSFISNRGEYAVHCTNISFASLVNTLIQTGDAETKKNVSDKRKTNGE